VSYGLGLAARREDGSSGGPHNRSFYVGPLAFLTGHGPRATAVKMIVSAGRRECPTDREHVLDFHRSFGGTRADRRTLPLFPTASRARVYYENAAKIFVTKKRVSINWR
jgi:hypothetical protein